MRRLWRLLSRQGNILSIGLPLMSDVSKAKRPILLLIDASHAVFRAFFAVRGLSSPSGMPTGAIFGFVSMLQKLIRERTPARIGVCFDTSAPTHRHLIDPQYKANRPEMPVDLQAQWPVCQQVAAQMGLPVLKLDGLEADDIMATLAVQGRAQGYEVIIVSGDKDLMQMVDDGDGDRPPIRQLDDGKDKLYDWGAVQEKWGVPPSQVRDLLAIMGDAVDNVPGVKGIGEKGAAKLLQAWGSLSGIYSNLESVEPIRIKELLRTDRDQALRAHELVGLLEDAVVPWSVDSLQISAINRAELAKTFADLGFKRLTAEFSQVDNSTVTAQPTAAVRVISDGQALRQVVSAIEAVGYVSLVACTDRLDADRTRPLYAKVVGLALAWGHDECCWLALGRADSTLEANNLPISEFVSIFGPLAANPAIAKFGCALKFEVLALNHLGIALHGIAGDAMLASYVDDVEKHAHLLRNIAFQILGEQLAPDEDVIGKGKTQTGWDSAELQSVAQLQCRKAILALRLCRWYPAQLHEVDALSVYRSIELPLVSVLARMEAAGIFLDSAELAKQSQWLGDTAAEAEAAIWQDAGRKFNVGSPLQLGEVLFDELKLPAKKRTQTGYSTDQSVLETLGETHDIANKVLRWRQLTKLKSTYADQLPLMVLPRTGRIHTWFGQAVAATGRLSSTDPNLQNIPVRTPEGRAIRRAFIAPSGRMLLSADYSQIELRLMAHLADDPGLQQAFRQGLDIHRETAARMFNLLPPLVSADQRSAAKTINFGILYGMGPQRLSREINVSLKEAKAFIERYFERFPSVHRWIEVTLEAARQSGEVRTLWGRRRPIAGLTSQGPADRAAAERIAVNTPVQGSAADLIKLAMLQVDRQLSGTSARMLLQVHDELVIEVAEQDAPAIAELVRETMQNCDVLPDGSRLKVPLQVDARWAASWADAH
ncbi:MAG: DNA polymerase I [Myxococcales bacterium]|nr:DNA polymerase I [Myxococcales bacterium]